MTEDCPRAARRVRWTPRLLLLVFLSLPLLPGCKGFEIPGINNTTEKDPLLNDQPAIPPGTGTTAPPTPPAPPPPQPGWNPPPAPTTTPNTPAGLTTAGQRPVDPAMDPRYGYSGVDKNGWQNANDVKNPPGNVPIRQPEPSASGPGSNVTQVSGVQGIQTMEQGYALLESLGMTWSTLTRKTATQPYQFECGIPNPQQPNTEQIIDGTGARPIDALRMALDKITKLPVGH